MPQKSPTLFRMGPSQMYRFIPPPYSSSHLGAEELWAFNYPSSPMRLPFCLAITASATLVGAGL